MFLFYEHEGMLHHIEAICSYKKVKKTTRIHQLGFESFVKKANKKKEDSSMRIDKQHNSMLNESRW